MDSSSCFRRDATRRKSCDQPNIYRSEQCSFIIISELNADSPVSRQRTNLGASRGQLNRNHPSQSSSYIRTRAPLSSNEPFKVDAIFSAHSDGLMVILRRRI